MENGVSHAIWDLKSIHATGRVSQQLQTTIEQFISAVQDREGLVKKIFGKLKFRKIIPGAML